MPPMIEDIENSASDGDSGADEVPARKPKAVAEVEEKDDDDDEEGAEDEYQVEKILGHKTHKGQVLYRIKWLGYSDDETTWEPEENLDGAKEILKAYHKQIGGKPGQGGSSKKSAKGKRSASEAFDTPTASGKKAGRKSNGTSSSGAWEPPVGSWEDDITAVAAIVDDSIEMDGKGTKDPQKLYGLLEWNNGKKTQHQLKLLRTKCPQRLLDYYEQHLLEPKLEEMANEVE